MAAHREHCQTCRYICNRTGAGDCEHSTGIRLAGEHGGAVEVTITSLHQGSLNAWRALAFEKTECIKRGEGRSLGELVHPVCVGCRPIKTPIRALDRRCPRNSPIAFVPEAVEDGHIPTRSEEHTSEL